MDTNKLKKREGYKIVIFEPAKSRLKRNECPSCGKPKSEWTRRKDWRCCSEGCTGNWIKHYVAYGWPDLRMKAFKRDRFICQKCKIVQEFRTESSWYCENFLEFKDRIEKHFLVRRYFCRVIKWGYGDRWETKYYAEVPDASKLIGDHIIPIALGGDEWDLNNIQTLCIPCNKIKTSDDLTQISKARKCHNLVKTSNNVEDTHTRERQSCVLSAGN